MLGGVRVTQRENMKSSPWDKELNSTFGGGRSTEITPGVIFKRKL